MARSYYQFRNRKIDSKSNILRGFTLGLADFSCLGWQLTDLAGYPYEDENAALFSDWVKLGQDLETAREKIDQET